MFPKSPLLFFGFNKTDFLGFQGIEEVKERDPKFISFGIASSSQRPTYPVFINACQIDQAWRGSCRFRITNTLLKMIHESSIVFYSSMQVIKLYKAGQSFW